MLKIAAHDKVDHQAWDVVITPKRALFDIGLREVWESRDLIALFMRRNFVVNYRQTVLGPFWYLAQPIATAAVYTIIFSIIIRMPTDGLPPVIFYLSGIIMWSNFSANLIATSDIFVANSGLFGKVYFPRLTVPIATVLTNFVTLMLQVLVFGFLFGFEIWRGRAGLPSAAIVLTPVLFVINTLFAFGCGLIMSALTTRYRDLTSVIGTALQLWMYATPIIYPLSQVPEKWRLLAAVNPLSTTVELFRLAAFGMGSVTLVQMAISAAVLAAVLAVGVALFGRAEMNAVDTV